MSSLKPYFVSLNAAQAELAQKNRSQKDEALWGAIKAIDSGRNEILSANAVDVEKARAGGMKEPLVDRLFLNDKRLDSIIEGIEAVIRLDDPIGKIKTSWKTVHGLLIEQTAIPLGTIAIIYESRPDVTVDAFSLAYKAGCSILLRGSSSALESNKALVKIIKKGLEEEDGIPGAVELAASGNRDEIEEILSARGFIDAVLPRGGHELIRRVTENARIPVIETGEGNCHIYVEPSADIPNAIDIIENAKLQKPGVCNSVETLLVHNDALAALMPFLGKRFAGKAELRCDDRSTAAIGELPKGLVLKPAEQKDWETEYLDYILAVKTVDSLDEAIFHINHYSTRNSEAILTRDRRAAEEFCARVDSACVYINASTRFTDGGMFGFGAELGISTQKFHVRGPMGLDALTSIKYRITGQGHIRE
jgi:glutamate-5-semialdehyde dehydrogenase